MKNLSTTVAVYDDLAAAQADWDAIEAASEGDTVDLADAALVTHDGERVTAVERQAHHAWGKGAVLVGAAGNNRREESYYPASFDNVVSVSATQPEDEFSNWSSWGPKVDVSAPGSSVQTTNCYTCTYADHDSWGAHTYISGTSFATPNVGDDLRKPQFSLNDLS